MKNRKKPSVITQSVVIVLIVAIFSTSSFAVEGEHTGIRRLLAVRGLIKLGAGTALIVEGISPIHILPALDRAGRSKLFRPKTPINYLNSAGPHVLDGTLKVIEGAVKTTAGVMAISLCAAAATVALPCMVAVFASRKIHSLGKKASWYASYRFKVTTHSSVYPKDMEFSQAELEALTDKYLPESIYGIERRHYLAKQRIDLAIEPEEITRENLAKWIAESKRRIDLRKQVIEGLEERCWGSNDTIMNTGVTAQYLESLNRLEARYPQAIPNAEFALHEYYEEVEKIDPAVGGKNGVLKKKAALRFLDRVATLHRYDKNYKYTFTRSTDFRDDPLRSGLRNIDVLALAWAAVNDPSFFPSEADLAGRKWGFVDSLAQIQRAHNEIGTQVSFDNKVEKDNPSCANGTFKRFLEHLDRFHPDVKIAELTADEGGAPGSGISNSLVALEVGQQHRILFTLESFENQAAILETFDSQGDAYMSYVENVREAVRQSAPLISETQLEANTSDIYMFTLLDVWAFERGTIAN